MSEQPQRRANDQRIDTLVQDVSDLKALTGEIKEILDAIHGFIAFCKVTATVSKWLAAIGAGLAAVYHGADFLSGKLTAK